MTITQEYIHQLTLDTLSSLKNKECIKYHELWCEIEYHLITVLHYDEDDERLDDAFDMHNDVLRSLEQNDQLIYRNSAHEFSFTTLTYFWRNHLYDVARNKPWYNFGKNKNF